MAQAPRDSGADGAARFFASRHRSEERSGRHAPQRASSGPGPKTVTSASISVRTSAAMWGISAAAILHRAAIAKEQDPNGAVTLSGEEGCGAAIQACTRCAGPGELFAGAIAAGQGAAAGAQAGAAATVGACAAVATTHCSLRCVTEITPCLTPCEHLRVPGDHSLPDAKSALREPRRLHLYRLRAHTCLHIRIAVRWGRGRSRRRFGGALSSRTLPLASTPTRSPAIAPLP